ncbi:succinic semialdehyde dehydrogenase [Galbitalea soli]|uniref:Aldehyde dehydrogenase family protein n=1 Tax=Galbitalea soli TaxID=1268042 RepID=A0A7C9TQG2_9MICO|nr:succinic semialdehyde dehydrogenase [Galbitalea soli]NEM90604.1 aldehyde dehydrogenase family protein [Galbitalea soli]NYJ31322.1 acyl-CoA reductase-like NAD-dependent aldehyde dehydrogenase [Galbitalea soli]
MSGSLLDRSTATALVSGLSRSGSATVPVIAPFTGSVLHELPTSSAHDVRDAAATARIAQTAWLRSGYAHRRAVLLKAHDLLLADRERLLDVLQTETGKTRGQAFEELFQGAGVTRYYAVSAARVLREQRRRAGIPLVMSTTVAFKPKGLVGVVTPWNYPLSLALMDVIPALAAGNAVVQKVDNQGALTVLAARQAFIAAGLPKALWAVVAGDGEEIGNAVVDVADYVCFTGSTATGTRVGVRAAGRLIGASLELGGKNPLIVLGDADPTAAAESAVYACFSSMGQLCVSIERIYVHRAISDAFIRQFVARVNALRQGPALDYSTDVGSLTSAAQLARVQAHVDDAIEKGALLLAGGRARPELGPYFYAPTVLAEVTSEMECFAHETFGPVVAISTFSDEDDAIAAANASEFGLNASVFSRSVAHGRRVAARISAGSVNINEGYRGSFSSLDAPMGGMKHSGLGRRNGPEGLLRFVDARTVSAATGLLALPRTGAEFARLSGPMLLLLRILKALGRR